MYIIIWWGKNADTTNYQGSDLRKTNLFGIFDSDGRTEGKIPVGLRLEDDFFFTFLHSVSRKLLTATHRARLPEKKKWKEMNTHIKKKILTEKTTIIHILKIESLYGTEYEDDFRNWRVISNGELRLAAIYAPALSASVSSCAKGRQ